MAYWANISRDAIGWKSIRIEISDHINSIAEGIDIDGSSQWADCFTLCGEDSIAGKLRAAPLSPDVAPEFSGPGLPVATAVIGDKASSSGSGIGSIVLVGKAPGNDEAKTDSSVTAIVAVGHAPGDEKAKAEPATPAVRRKLPWINATHNKN